MCIAGIAIQESALWPIVVVHNRDEFRNRPYSNLAQFGEVYGGQDLPSSGMWCGVTTTGKVGLITSYRDPTRRRPSAPSRGPIVRNYLEQGLNAPEYLDLLSKNCEQFNPFNLVVGEIPHSIYYWNSDEKKPRLLGKGIHALSNGYLDSRWAKVERFREGFREVLLSSRDADFHELEHSLIALLRNDEKLEDSLLPRTGVPIEWERFLSSAFVDAPNYGTLVSTIFAQDAVGRRYVAEIDYNHGNHLSEYKF